LQYLQYEQGLLSLQTLQSRLCHIINESLVPCTVVSLTATKFEPCGFGAHPASYPIGTGGFFPRGKAAGA